MLRSARTIGMGALGVFFCLFFCGGAVGGQTATITGNVVAYTIETDDGTVYEIADTEKGNELAEYSGTRVRVTGTVEEDDLGKVINVQSYTALEEGDSSNDGSETGSGRDQSDD